MGLARPDEEGGLQERKKLAAGGWALGLTVDEGGQQGEAGPGGLALGLACGEEAHADERWPTRLTMQSSFSSCLSRTSRRQWRRHPKSTAGQRRLRQVRATGGTGEDRSGPGGLIPGDVELGKLQAVVLPGEREREIR